jgi:predicted nucleic acid-binding protein
LAGIVLADSSALVAALDRRDRYHAWARAHFESFDEPCITCDAVLSEAFFLLGRLRTGKEQFCTLLERGVVRAQFAASEHLAEVLRLMRRYGDTSARR